MHDYRARIKLDELERTCLKQYTKQKQLGNTHQVTLEVGVQSFDMLVAPESKSHALWFRMMMAKALAKVVREQSESETAYIPDLDALPQFLIDARKRLKVSQKELAKRTGFMPQAICRYEKTKYQGATLTVMLRVAIGLGFRSAKLEDTVKDSPTLTGF